MRTPAWAATSTAYSGVQWPQVDLRGELVGPELGIVDQHVGVSAEFEHRGVDVAGSPDGLLVVGHVGDRDAVAGHPVAVGLAAVGNGSDHDLGAVDLEVVVVGVVELDGGREIRHLDREVGRTHERRERRRPSTRLPSAGP